MKRADAAKSPLSYAHAGVDTEAAASALAGLLPSVRQTFSFRPAFGRPVLPIGYFANVLDIGNNTGLAISTDGVGTKILVAELMDKYDTIGVDCVAMNANDIICVGAEPIAMTDYLAVEVPESTFFEEVGKGLLAGAREANVTIPGGELSQIGEMLKGERPGRAFDLVGTCVGTVPLDQLLIGQAIGDGDILVGLASSGIHSNGLTLARRALIERGRLTVDSYVAEFGRTVGEELLEPTRIYVRFAMTALRAGLPVKAFAHITGDGLLNLSRVASEVGYDIEVLPELPPVFRLIQQLGEVPDEEMFRVFNMGVGFCAVVSPGGVQALQAIARDAGIESFVMGAAQDDLERRVRILPKGLEGKGGSFRVA